MRNPRVGPNTDPAHSRSKRPRAHGVGRGTVGSSTWRSASWIGVALGLSRFDGQGWWLGQATCLMTSWSVVVSNSSGVM
jgi:hypothetical protein